MGVKFTGDWDGVGKTATRLERNQERLNTNVSRIAAVEYLNTVRNAIETHVAPGGMGVWKLSLSWIRRKKNDAATWFNTGKFIKLLTIEKVDRNGTVFAGASRKTSYDGKLSMADVASFGEYGTRRESGKPLFGPARVVTIKRIEEKLVRHVKRAITTDAYGTDE